MDQTKALVPFNMKYDSEWKRRELADPLFGEDEAPLAHHAFRVALRDHAAPLEAELLELRERLGKAVEILQTLVDNPPSNNPTYTHMPTIQAKAFLSNPL